MMASEQKTAFGRVLGSLMESRGVPATREKMAELAEKSGLDAEGFLAHVTEGVQDYVQDLSGLDEELGLSQTEMLLLANAYVWEKGCAGDVRANLFEQITIHLDFVACIDEEEHGGTQASRHIRKALIPFCEVEAALARQTEE
jgi:hypothetical protein